MNVGILIGLALLIGILPVQSGEIHDRRWIVSPNHRHLLIFSGSDRHLPDAFTIQDTQGNIVFSTKNVSSLKEVACFNAAHVAWSPDGQFVAIAGGHPKYFLTCIFARDETGFVPVAVPELTGKLDNPWILPDKWTSSRILRVKISGPYAGKANGYGYAGEVKLKVRRQNCTILSRRITSTDRTINSPPGR